MLNLDTTQSVIATGGSAIYSARGLEKLANSGDRIYIQVSLQSLQLRIADMGQRGLVMSKGQTFEQLYRERTPLYEKFADLTISCDEINAEGVAAKIEEEISQR